MIKAIIIDDEAHCRETLDIMLRENFTDISVVAKCSSAEQGIEMIMKQDPDIVFLDIEMPEMNGFDLLGKLTKPSFSIIFTTGYDQYAIKSFQYNATDYLVKPIDAAELKRSVEKARHNNSSQIKEQFEALLDKVRKKDGFSKIAVPTAEGFELVPVEDILYLEARNTYTSVSLKNGRKILACRTLKEMEEQVEDRSFFIRVHHSYVVNLNEVIKYVRGDGGYLLMSDNSTVSVSRSRKDDLLSYF